MTDNTQPEALRLADWLQAAVQIYPQRSEDEPGGYASEVDQVMDDAAAELRRLHTENTALQQGYAAARLEIESLQARIKTMAEKHADELMVAHMDGMRAAQPAGAQQPSPTPQADSQPASDEIIRMAREAGLPETETEGVFRVNADDLGRIFASYRAARAPADSVLEDAARYRWLRASTNYVTSNGERIDVRNTPEKWDAAIDAARKQGANHE